MNLENPQSSVRVRLVNSLTSSCKPESLLTSKPLTLFSAGRLFLALEASFPRIAERNHAYSLKSR